MFFMLPYITHSCVPNKLVLLKDVQLNRIRLNDFRKSASSGFNKNFSVLLLLVVTVSVFMTQTCSLPSRRPRTSRKYHSLPLQIACIAGIRRLALFRALFSSRFAIA
jgi:hypothetical protein